MSQMPSLPLVQTKNLSVKMGQRTLVSGLDWQVQSGEFWCVLGKNGVGKSSLLSVLAGLLPRSGGALQFTAQSIAQSIDQLDDLQLARLRGLMMQHQSDAFSHSVADTVLIGRTPYRVGRSWDAEQDIKIAHQALARVGLLDKLHADITQLSGGERQRVALAGLLAQDPGLMLLDEPTAHQDVAQQLAIMRLACELAQTHALIASCHDINLAMRFATHVLVLGEDQHWQGRVAEVMTVQILAQAFGCSFSLRGGQFIAE